MMSGLAFATPSQAYFTTNQQAFSVNEQNAFYTIDFRFGLTKYDLYMPIMAMRDLAWGSNQKTLGYEILEESKVSTTTGIANGIVLSNAEVVDGMYKVPAGTAITFTLFVVYTVEASDEETDYALHVQELPFYIGDKMSSQKLNPSELQYYISPEAEMNPN